jgi:predicted nucleic acid-binding protein
MKAAIVDTDTISYFFRGNADVAAKLHEYLLEHGRVYLSVVTYYEILNGLYFKDAKKQLAQFEKFVSLNKVLPLTAEIAKTSARIYANLRTIGQTVSHNDVLIAGTAIVNNLALVTNNTSHFSRISALDIDNWTKV